VICSNTVIHSARMVRWKYFSLQ